MKLEEIKKEIKNISCLVEVDGDNGKYSKFRNIDDFYIEVMKILENHSKEEQSYKDKYEKLKIEIGQYTNGCKCSDFCKGSAEMQDYLLVFIQNLESLNKEEK